MHHGSLRITDNVRGRVGHLVLGNEFLRSANLFGCNRLEGATDERSDKRRLSNRWGEDVMGDNCLRGSKTKGGDKRRPCSNHGRDNGVSGGTQLR